MHRWISASLLWALLVVMGAADAQTSRRQRSKLEQSQIALTAAIRWGDFETAWQMVDPAYKQAHPLSDFELSRYAQVQISGYRDLSSQLEADDTVIRNIELRVINKHTLAERTLRYQERWRWDAENRRWWLASGLPDLWRGQ